ncbi:phosphoglycerate mutase (2,3-diphosphoglycerate-independent) [Candidatus Wolfebacteria bacterium RIFCSPLOWO2_01_FULL_45_19]|uniref:2,3-bisphosphoglycerate-independent phosphoglycerate mutase n=1 Tax=Candidatus Wolfebacteria bacterium RIFCSPLOWO2_01_FULL_45_19 TaxID=1802557 RepID=A0A1F8DR63_9BACT|nr:MAG: 2,3-bisphosphoglycerate-independent phosphoglycerate mutase [Parcubacteria group bacterium GW2011_GWB1_45_9]OGM91084.1 MAG: phosphoglycerate mutase (2,3-diphosphoglycerate-independent) [Candidatus Wolfebacteria bacterium RIFCSPLOWO2_01_FULL_45_19]
MARRTIILAILDGWGIGREDESNPIYIAKPKTIEYIKHNYLAWSLQSSGIAVGLPWEEEGNSEVGHLTIGAGKTIYQHFPRITLAIRDESFFKNEALLNAIKHAKKNNSALNLVGLLTSGNVHSSLEHLEALIKLAALEKVPHIKLHLFTDGKDSPPRSAMELIEKVKKMMVRFKIGEITSVSGRYYALDRDKHWDRTRLAYEAITGKKPSNNSLEDLIQRATYGKNLSDEFVDPISLNAQNPLRDGDAVIFFNFREDGMRQLVEAFVNKQFEEFPTEKFSNLYVAAMTQYYEKKFPMPVAFLPEKIINPIGKVISDAGKHQLRIAETEKYAHVTYFFNGFRDTPSKNEYRLLVPSKNIPRHEEHPEMMARELTARVIESIDERAFEFIVINYANPDVIAHTGNFDACVKAIEVIDECVNQLMKTVLQQDGVLIITSDHGNIERVRSPLTAAPETKHDPNPVPIYIIGNEFKKTKSEFQVRLSEAESSGILADIAPTILALMNIPKPEEMTGQNLLRLL